MKHLFVLFLLIINAAAFSQSPNRMRAFMQQAPSPANAVPYGNNPKAGHYVQTKDAKIYYEVYGQGKPLVVLHGGIVGSTYEMAQFIDSLAKTYQVIAVSTRGHGKSEIGYGIPSYERKAEDVNTIIQAVTKDSVLVLGFSDGAYTGYFLAASHPDKIKKLIAIGAGEWKPGWRTFDNTRQSLFSLDSLYFKQQLALLPQPERVDDWLLSVNRYYNTVSIGKQVLGRIQCPVLVMAGEKDQNAPLKTVISAYELMPKAQLSIIPNAPHPVFLTNFPAVWASMLPFLTR
ncbi:MAG: alpha/beta hydrolase [Cytophagaceae bacterium]|nr:MAG: alpha/beta hydrolase [Cytophagaceae bacterium]